MSSFVDREKLFKAAISSLDPKKRKEVYERIEKKEMLKEAEKIKNASVAQLD